MSEPAASTPTMDPGSIQRLFNEWWQLASGIIVTVAGVIGSGLGVPPPYNTWIAASVFVVGLVFLLFYSRREKSRREAEARRKEAEGRLKLQAATFRMLQRYRASEFLPGQERRRQGFALKLKVAEPEFRLIVVVGESGAGKSSLLEASLTTSLREENFTVLLFNNILRLSGVAQGATAEAVLDAFATEEEKQLKNKVQDSKVIYVIDQFEELLSRFRSDDERKAIGALLEARSAGGAGIVIGLRKEYLAELKDVMSQLSFSVGFHDFFQVHNFDPTEAQAVIRECANMDSLALDPALPPLVVTDLTIDDRIRPADLQIICGMLSGELTVERYEREGGAVGLQSRFIASVIDISGEPLLARTILRELCDIPNNKKAAEALTSEQLAERARAGAAGDLATPANVDSVLKALHDALILVKDSTMGVIRWSLIHDYLVRPIALATEKETTNSEAASRRLDFYLGQARTNRRVIIPLIDLIAIRRDVPPAKRRQPNVKRLMTRSIVYGYGWSFARTALVAIAVFIVFIGLTTQTGQWRDSNPLNHWTGGERRSDLLTATPMNDKDGSARVAVHSMMFDRSSNRVTLWDAKTGDPLYQYNGHLSVTGNKIWDFDAATSTLKRLPVLGMEPKTVTLSDASMDDLVVEKEIDDSHVEVRWPDPKTNSPIRAADAATIDLTSGKGNILTQGILLPPGSPADAQFSFQYANVSAYVGMEIAASAAASRLSIWNKTGGVLYTEDFDGDTEIFPVDSISIGKITYFILARLKGDQASFRTFRLTSSGGEPADSNNIEAGPWVYEDKLTVQTARERDSFSFYTPRLSIAGTTKLWVRGSPDRILVVDPASSKVLNEIPTVNLKVVSVIRPKDGERHSDWTWQTPGHSEWNFLFEKATGPSVLRGVDLTSFTTVQFSDDLKTALAIRTDGSGEIWSTDFDKQTASVRAKVDSQGYASITFSGDQNVIISRSEGGYYQLWSRDGISLGALGKLGANLVWSTYDETCRRFLLWDSDGERLDFQRGFVIPGFGILPERSCSPEKSLFRKVLDKIIP